MDKIFFQGGSDKENWGEHTKTRVTSVVLNESPILLLSYLEITIAYIDHN